MTIKPAGATLAQLEDYVRQEIHSFYADAATASTPPLDPATAEKAVQDITAAADRCIQDAIAAALFAVD
jgi:hypothetical protein